MSGRFILYALIEFDSETHVYAIVSERMSQRKAGYGSFNGAAFDVVAMASSAGGLTALIQVLTNLPATFPAAIAIVQHLDPRHRSLMADILSRRTALFVKEAAEGDSLQPGTVYIAPPDRHLLVNSDGTLSLTQSELVHFVRPSADLLFESVAASYRDRAIAVVLTGTGSDGSMGVQAIKKMQGTLIVQDKQTSDFFGMPGAAIQTGGADFVLPLDEIAPALVTLVSQGAATERLPVPGGEDETA
jgi:two-component system, chemotaxis family, protein-glutamate methylesterase/glutaminase